MESNRLSTPLHNPHKERQIKDAQDMYRAIVRSAERLKSKVPPYDFIELIGKGGFGRVYKCREQETGQLVAVKIVATDEADFIEHTLDRDSTIESFRKEVSILQQLKDSKAKNVNMIHDAFDLHSQLWIVSDYCTGGSLRTLLRASPANKPGFDERYIIPIARELAIALKSVHDIGVIHRDIKCGNVYVNEEGQIQLGDFGIVGIIDDGVSKRRTIIGTPHWLPLEINKGMSSNEFKTQEAYGTEVDIWSYGITIYEAATGHPPNQTVRQAELGAALLTAPRLEGAEYSAELKDFVAFCLATDPKQRPTADQLLKHPYIANTAHTHPTSNLIDLIDRYAAWEYKGGQRASLWFAGGAAGPSEESPRIEETQEDWVFSTSDHFTKAFNQRQSQMISVKDFAQIDESKLTPFEVFQRKYREMSAERGERSLNRVFDPDAAPYELHVPMEPTYSNDLPLRNLNNTAATRESLIDLDDANVFGSPNLDLSGAPTLKVKSSRKVPKQDEFPPNEKRATMDWKFPLLNNPSPTEPDSLPLTAKQDKKRATMDWKFPDPPPDKKRATMEWTMATAERLDSSSDTESVAMHTPTDPIFESFPSPQGFQQGKSTPAVRDSMGSIIDLDLADASRPITSSSETTHPFDLDDDVVGGKKNSPMPSLSNSFSSERPSPMLSLSNSLPAGEPAGGGGFAVGTYNRLSVGKHPYDIPMSRQASGQSDLDPFPSLSSDEFHPYQEGGFSRRRAATANSTGGSGVTFPELEPPAVEVLLDECPDEVRVEELDRLLQGVAAAAASTSSVLCSRAKIPRRGGREEN